MGGNFGYYYWIISKYEFLLDDQMIQIFISLDDQIITTIE